MKPITILLAEDHQIIREMLRRFLDLQTDMQVVGEVSDGIQALAARRELAPDLVLMDIGMPLMNGLEATRLMKIEDPILKVLILTGHGDDDCIAQARKLGAAGFLPKLSSTSELCRAIRHVHQGLPFFEWQNEKQACSGGSPPGLLTPRETEVLKWIALGHANKQTASELSISIKTVEKHRENLMAKLGIHDTAGLTRHAIREGIIGVFAPLTRP